MQMKDLAKRLAERGIALAVSDAALDYVLAESYDLVYGVRPIRRWLKKRVITELSKMLIKDEIDENSAVFIDAGMDGLAYRVDKNVGMVDAATGQKADVLIQVPNGPRSDATQAAKKIKIQELEDDDEMID